MRFLNLPKKWFFFTFFSSVYGADSVLFKFEKRYLKMYGSEGRPKKSTKTHSARITVLLAENSGSEEEDQSAPAPSTALWHADFNKYLDDDPEDIPSGMTLVQWWRVCIKSLLV